MDDARRFDLPLRRFTRIVLARLAPDFGFSRPGKGEDPTRYNTLFRNVVLSHLSGERVLRQYAQGGLPAVKAEIDELRRRPLL